MTGSIRRRLALGTALGLAVVLAAAGIAIDALAGRALTDQFDAALAARARALAVLVEQEGDEVETDLDPRLLPDLAGGAALWIEVTVDDELLYRSPHPRPAAGASRAVRHDFAPRQEAGDPAPARAATLTLVQSTAALDDSRGGVRAAIALAGVLALALALALVAWLGRFVVAPIARLADAIGAVDATAPAARLDPAAPATRLDPATAPAELRVVVERLNELLARVEAAIARERELTAEIAHELRTPLAGITATLEVALDRERSPERYQAALRDALAISAQTATLLDALLALARLDAAPAAATCVDVELAALVETALARARPAAAARGLTITADLAPAALVHTDPALLAAIVANLLDNAVAHADAGGHLEVAISGRTLRVANTGSQIDAADAARTLQRFWRGDRARAIGVHAGLGLALCHKLATVLGARLTVTTERGGWFRVAVELP
jgi:signal transduction histidine kinase